MSCTKSVVDNGMKMMIVSKKKKKKKDETSTC